MNTINGVASHRKTSVIHAPYKKEAVVKLVAGKIGADPKFVAKSGKDKKPLPTSGLYKEVIISSFNNIPYIVIKTSKGEYAIKLGSGPKALIIPVHSTKQKLRRTVEMTLKANY